MADAFAHIAKQLPDGSVAVRSVQVPGGGYASLSNAAGAPCCCGSTGADCYVRLMPCFCNDPAQIRFIPFTLALDAAWPKEDREGGIVISVDGKCWVFYGTVVGPVDQSLVVSSASPAFYDNCFVSPCADQTPCPPCSTGFTQIRNSPSQCPPVRSFTRSCLQRLIATTDAKSVYSSEFRQGSSVVKEDATLTLSARFQWDYVGGVRTLVAWEVTSSGIIAQSSTSPNTNDRFEFTQTYNQDDPGDWSFFNIALQGGNPIGNERSFSVPIIHDGQDEPVPGWVSSNPTWTRPWTWEWNDNETCGQHARTENETCTDTDYELDLTVNFGDSGSSLSGSSSSSQRNFCANSTHEQQRSGYRRTSCQFIHIDDDYNEDDECEASDGGGGGGGGGGGSGGTGKVDIGDPSDPNNDRSTDPAMLAEVKRQEKAYGCSGCGG